MYIRKELVFFLLSLGIILLAGMGKAWGMGAVPQQPDPPVGTALGAVQAPRENTTIFLPLVSRGILTGLVVEHAGGRFTYLNGSSCAGCHPAEAQAAFQSNHYQWQGKLGSINDFCGYPDINQISILTNLLGQKVNGGCAVCHAGMGKKPDQGGIENVDCLMCHSVDYKRNVVDVGGTLQFVPQAGETVVRAPGRQECLRCHIGAGGGPNNKRGDLEPAHNDPPSADFDVHMASQARGGAGLVCTNCHTSQSHKIAGRGVDLRIDEGVEMKRCADCHASAPHDDLALNRHTARVACQVCHIPAFARLQSTDMYRDFRSVEVDLLKNLYEPKLTRQANVIPVYTFWNGGTTFYNYGAPAVNGTFLAAPQGGINDPASKLFPFKLHHAMQAHDPLTGMLLPIKAGILFQTGDVDRAIRQAASELGIAMTQDYDFVETGRYMGIFHEVAPASEALECDDCHPPSASRIDFTSLGYTPKATRNGLPLCSSCHEPEDEGWPPSQYFYELHNKHVREEGKACAECHNFSR
jgi:hypothetical protein